VTNSKAEAEVDGRAAPGHPRPHGRVLALSLALAFGPVLAVVLVLALRDGSHPLTTGLSLILLLVVILGPLLGFVALVVLGRRRRL